MIPTPRNLKPMRVGWVQRDDGHLGKKSCMAKFLHLYPRPLRHFETLVWDTPVENTFIRHFPQVGSPGFFLKKVLQNWSTHQMRGAHHGICSPTTRNPNNVVTCNPVTHTHTRARVRAQTITCKSVDNYHFVAKLRYTHSPH